MRISAATILFFFSLVSASQGACFVNRFPITLGSDTSTSATTDGAPCTIRLLSSRNPIYGTNITLRPRDGKASINGRTTVVYEPKAGFKGQDSFAFQYVGKEGGITPMATTINVRVTIN
jgi:hypothetical protein